jgi:hypothetical protein
MRSPTSPQGGGGISYTPTPNPIDVDAMAIDAGPRSGEAINLENNPVFDARAVFRYIITKL